MEEQQFYFGNVSCSLPFEGKAQLTEDGSLSLICMIGDYSYARNIKLPDSSEEVSRLVVREEPLCILVCYETKIVDIDGSNLISILLHIPEQDGDMNLPWCFLSLVMCRTHTVQLRSSVIGCCFSPYDTDCYFVVDYKYMFYYYSTQRHTGVPLVQFSLREYLDSQLSPSLLSDPLCDVVFVSTTIEDEVAVAFLLSSGYWIVVEGLPLQFSSNGIHYPPLCPRLDRNALRVYVSGIALPCSRLRYAFIRKFAILSSVMSRLSSLDEKVVYIVASAQAVVVALYIPTLHGFSTLAVHDLSLLELKKPSFLLNPFRAAIVVEQGTNSKRIAFGEVLRAAKGRSVWRESSTSMVPVLRERMAESVPETRMRAMMAQERAAYYQEVARKEVQCIDHMYGEMDDKLGLDMMDNTELLNRVLGTLIP